MDIGINTMADLDVPFSELLPMISAAGFGYVSLSHRVGHAGYHMPSRREAIAGELESNQLKLNYLHVPIEAYHDLSSPDPQVRLVTIETYKMCIQACAALGGRSVVAHATGRMELADEEVEQAVEASIESSRELAAYAHDHGVVFCLENLPADRSWQKVTMRVMAGADFPGLGLCVDTCHAMIGSDDPVGLVKWMAPRVVATHLSDTMGDHDSHLLPGDGRVDYQAVARELARAGFCGVVDLECSLSMLRHRRERKCQHPGDTVPCSAEHYLERAAAAANRIAEYLVSSERHTGS